MDNQRRDPHSVSDTANPGHRYEHGFDPTDSVGKSLRVSENSAAGTGAEDTAANTGTDDIQQREEQAAWPTSVTPKDAPQQNRSWTQKITGTFKGSKKKSASMVILGILLGLLGIGGFFSFTFAPIMALNNVVLDLGDFRSAGETRIDKILAKKFMKTARGTTNKATIGCNGISSVMPIKCKYSTMSNRLVEKLKAGGIEVIGEKAFGNRIKPESISFTDKNGTKVVVPADEFKAHLSNHPSDMYKFNSALNKNFLLMRGKTMIQKALGRYGITDAAPDLEGTHEERVKQLMNGEGAGEIDTTRFKPKDNSKTDADGNPTEYVLIDDPDGKVFTPDQAKTAEVEVGRVSSAKRTPSQLELGAAKAINLVGWLDTACSFKNLLGAATVAQKVAGAAQLGQYAGRYASLIGKMQAGDISPEDARVLQEAFTSTDARKEIVNLAGTSLPDELFAKIGIERPKEMIANPNYGRNAMDSELIKVSTNGGVPHTTLIEKAYSLGTGQNSILSAAAKVTNFTEDVFSLPETISGGLLSCDNVQKGWVRGLGLIGGVILGLYSGGGSVLANFAAIIPIAIATYALSQGVNALLSGSIISNVMEHAPVDRGSAFWTGMSVIMSQASLSRGMMPGDADQIVAYQQQQNVSKQAEIALRRRQSNPLDITDPYSVVGTLAYSISEHMPSTISGSSITSLSSFVFGGLASSLTPYSANAASLEKGRFTQCDDESYKEIGIDADVQCNVRYVLPTSSMQLDPLDAALYMEDHGYVEKDTATGFPKDYTPPEPEKSQGLAMDFIKGMAKSTKDSFYYNEYDKYKDAADYAKFLDFCVYRTLPFGEVYEDGEKEDKIGKDWLNGANCRKDEEPFNYFRTYVFDMSVDDDLDGPIENTNNNKSGGGGARITEAQLRALIKEYGLPDPKADVSSDLQMYGSAVKGYDDLFKHLTDNPKASWAAGAMLAGEKKFMDKGGDLKEYLNTAWVWFETDQDGWPDPYQINCDDNRDANGKVGGAPERSHVSYQCTVGNFQSAGYQAADRAMSDSYTKMFKMFYSDSELASVMEQVLKNSNNAMIDAKSYNNSEQRGKGLLAQNLQYVSNATMSDIATSRDELLNNGRKQFMTLLLGKDPNIATALNSFAVSDSDLINALKSSACGYGYICEPHRQALSNMIYALWLYDSQFGIDDAAAAAGSALAGWTLSRDSNTQMDYKCGSTEPMLLLKHAMWGDVAKSVSQLHGPGNSCFAIENKDSIYKDYDFPSYGFGSIGHPGYDVSMDVGTQLYSPVEGIVATAGGSGYFYNTPGQAHEAGSGELKIVLKNGDEVIMGHMQSINVAVGTSVKPGTPVGKSGYPSAPHLHLEYRKKVATSECSSGFCIIDPTHAIP